MAHTHTVSLFLALVCEDIMLSPRLIAYGWAKNWLPGRFVPGAVFLASTRTAALPLFASFYLGGIRGTLTLLPCYALPHYVS